MLLKYVKALRYAVAMMIDDGSTYFTSKDKQTDERFYIEWETLYEILSSFEKLLKHIIERHIMHKIGLLIFIFYLVERVVNNARY